MPKRATGLSPAAPFPSPIHAYRLTARVYHRGWIMTIQNLLENGALREEQMFPGAMPLLTNAPHGKAMCVVCGKWRSYLDLPNGHNGECGRCHHDQHGIEFCAWCGMKFKLSASQQTRYRRGLPVYCSKSHSRRSTLYT